MFKHDFATGQWVPVGASAWSNSNQPTDHIVLVYDWAAESAFFEDGWLEAAADNLYASLLSTNANLAGGLQGVSFFDAALAAGGGGGLLDLHFIGHSRGGVLNSLVAERFDHALRRADDRPRDDARRPPGGLHERSRIRLHE